MKHDATRLTTLRFSNLFREVTSRKNAVVGYFALLRQVLPDSETVSSSTVTSSAASRKKNKVDLALAAEILCELAVSSFFFYASTSSFSRPYLFLTFGFVTARTATLKRCLSMDGAVRLFLYQQLDSLIDKHPTVALQVANLLVEQVRAFYGTEPEDPAPFRVALCLSRSSDGKSVLTEPMHCLFSSWMRAVYAASLYEDHNEGGSSMLRRILSASWPLNFFLGFSLVAYESEILRAILS
jgi:hypothetical protein